MSFYRHHIFQGYHKRKTNDERRIYNLTADHFLTLRHFAFNLKVISNCQRQTFTITSTKYQRDKEKLTKFFKCFDFSYIFVQRGAI